MTAVPRADRLDILARVPLFAHLDAAARERVAGLFRGRTFRKGEVVCREGDPGDRFFVVVSGELEVRAGGEAGRLLNRLGPGEVLGEMALLFEQARTATVTVHRSARLLELERDAFREHFSRDPGVLQYFSRLLSQRLAANARGAVGRARGLVVAVHGPARLRGKTLVASALAGILRGLTGRDVLRVRVRAPDGPDRRRAPVLSLPEVAEASEATLRRRLVDGPASTALLPLAATESADEEACTRGLTALLDRLGPRFPLLVLDLGAAGASVAAAAGQVADAEVRLVARARPGDGSGDRSGPRRYRVVNLAHGGTPIPINHCEPFVLRDDPALRSLSGTEAGARVAEGADSPLAAPLFRLARRLLGTSVGVALGGGAAFGIAHVGVFEVFERSGIPVDLVAGTSMGSIVALGFAAGLSGSEMHAIARRIGTPLTTLSAVDPTLTRPGLLAGNRLVRIFSPLLEARGFEDLRRPCRTVAMDIESGERISIGEGRLEDAFRASCSVPLIWAPVRRDGRVLVDGAMTDPVPADVVAEMGADLCIAINVVPPLKKGVDNVLTRAWRRLNRLNPLPWLGGDRDLPTTFDVVMNTIQSLQHELGKYKAISADATIVPDLSDFTWIEFYRPDEIIERGIVAAEAAVPELRRLLDDRLARAPGGEAARPAAVA